MRVIHAQNLFYVIYLLIIYTKRNYIVRLKSKHDNLKLRALKKKLKKNCDIEYPWKTFILNNRSSEILSIRYSNSITMKR